VRNHCTLSILITIKPRRVFSTPRLRSNRSSQSAYFPQVRRHTGRVHLHASVDCCAPLGVSFLPEALIAATAETPVPPRSPSSLRPSSSRPRHAAATHRGSGDGGGGGGCGSSADEDNASCGAGDLLIEPATRPLGFSLGPSLAPSPGPSRALPQWLLPCGLSAESASVALDLPLALLRTALTPPARTVGGLTDCSACAPSACGGGGGGAQGDAADAPIDCKSTFGACVAFAIAVAGLGVADRNFLGRLGAAVPASAADNLRCARKITLDIFR